MAPENLLTLNVAEDSVVKALRQQYNVREGIINSQDDHRWEHTLQDRAQNIENIAGKPDDNKLDAQSFS
nr:hypothetical protein CFP56_30029 [Quercus suber]